MSRKRSSQRKHLKPKAVLRLADLDQAKSAVLNSLSSVDAQRGYRHAVDEFVEWHCSEPRLSFSRTVVLRYRMHLESRHLAPGTTISDWALSAAWPMRRLIVALEPRLGCLDQKGEESQQNRRTLRKLAHSRTVPNSLAGSPWRPPEGEAPSRTFGHATPGHAQLH